MIPADLAPLWISLKTSIAATALSFVLGIAAAIAMWKYKGRARGVLDGLLALPLVLPPTVVGFLLLLVFGRRGAVGHMLESIGLSIAFSWPATVVAATVVAFPLMYRSAWGAFEQVNPSLLDAARTLGASEWRTIRLVLLPLARPGVIAGTVLAFARALGEFGATLMLAGNIPGKTQTMPVALFFAADGGDMARAFTWVVLIILLSTGAIAALNFLSTRRPATPVPTGPDTPIADPPTNHPLVLVRNPLSVDLVGSGPAGLSVRGLNKRCSGFELNASFASDGGVLGLLGASGSGKSMVLRCIAGLERPSSGCVELNGRVLVDVEGGISLAPARRRIGMVFQDYALFPHLTVHENIAFGLFRHTAEERRTRGAYWSSIVQVDSLAERYPHQLSGGQKQRVALARALAMEPEALLLDEPLSALDPHLRRTTEEQLRNALATFPGVTIFVTHDRDEAFRLSENLVVLADGQVAAAGPKREIFARPRSLAVARLTGCKNLAAMRRSGPAEIHVAEWSCTLKVGADAPEDVDYVGVRSHDLQFTSAPNGENTFPCWLVASIESPFETTLYLHLHAPPEPGDAAHLAAELSRQQWKEFSKQPQPWYLHLDPARLLLVAK